MESTAEDQRGVKRSSGEDTTTAPTDESSTATASTSLFTCSDDEFESWIASQLAQIYPTLKADYPELFEKAPICFVKWRQRFHDNPALWRRLFKSDNVLKEFAEAVPVLDAVIQLIEKADALNEQDGIPNKQYTIIDVCSGKGYLSMLLSELLPPDKVFRIVLMDKAFAMRNQQPQSHHINWEHIYGEKPKSGGDKEGEFSIDTNNDATSNANKPSYYDTWPISLDTSKQDLKATRQLNNIPKHYFSEEHPAIILAIHLCGTLSLRAVQLYNDNPDTVHFLALKPCCLPGMVHAKRHEIFEIGSHKFDSKEVCIHGKWKQNKWVGGPPRSHIQQKFQVWASHLYCGIVATAENEVDENAEEMKAETMTDTATDQSTAARKLHCRIKVQQDGGFQNDFLFAQRIPTTDSVWDRLQPYQMETIRKDNASG